MLKHYVEFLYTSIVPFPDGPTEQEIPERDDLFIVMPDKAVGYRFFSRNEKFVNGTLLQSTPFNFSPYVLFPVDIFYRKDVKEFFGKNSLEYATMKMYKATRAVVFEDGTLYFPKKEDKVILLLQKPQKDAP